MLLQYLHFISLVLCLHGILAAPHIPYIVGGSEVYPAGKWPMICSLQFKPAIGDWGHTCGCALIDDDHVLTAAHCVQGYTVDQYYVLLGAHDIETRLYGQPEEHYLSEIIIHPDFAYDSNQGYPNDTAILRLSTTVDVGANDFIEIAQLAETDSDFLGQECYIVGWGQTQGIGPTMNILREAQTDPLTNEDCKAFWPIEGERWVGPYHICVHDVPDENTGSCFGDSGGPLLCRESGAAEWLLAGTTSWGYGGCTTSYPSVYARTSYFRDWIDTIITTP